MEVALTGVTHDGHAISTPSWTTDVANFPPLREVLPMWRW
jgi:hypothetical protein